MAVSGRWSEARRASGVSCTARSVIRPAGQPKNPVERENWPPRWKAEDRRRHSESRFEPAQRGPPPSSPFVEIAEQDRRHRRQAAEGRHQGVHLVDARKPEEAKMRRDDAKLAFARGRSRRRSRLAARAPAALSATAGRRSDRLEREAHCRASHAGATRPTASEAAVRSRVLTADGSRSPPRRPNRRSTSWRAIRSAPSSRMTSDDSIRPGHAVEAAALVDVVGCDLQGRPRFKSLHI